MSEAVLKAIIQLCALVAKENGIDVEERNHLKKFLINRLSQQAALEMLALFDSYTQSFTARLSDQQELETINSICSTLNKEIVQKQKIIVMVELMGIVLADGTISTRENKLVRAIGDAFHIDQKEIDNIELLIAEKTAEQLDHKQVLIVDNRKRPHRCKHIFRDNSSGFIAFLYIESVKIHLFKYAGSVDLLVNGTFKQPNQISVLAVGSTLRWGNTPPLYYRDILIQFKKPEHYQKLSFCASNLTYTFKDKNPGVEKINLLEESSNLIAIMGTSGSGKSTLLHLLNSILKPQSGQVLLNGIDIHKEPEKLKGIIGFVPQEDMLIEDLTVYQNLYFAAQFYFKNLSKEERNRRVIDTLERLGLLDIRNLKVGSVLKKKISGGQRKRLNIGLELLRKPTVLFCDEPTSGLSSWDSENILELLKELTHTGKLVFTVIHQPSSDIFKMFDKLIILDKGGRMIYYGNPIEAITYFKNHISAVNTGREECNACGNVNPEQIFSIIETTVVDEYGNITNKRKYMPEEWAKVYENKKKIKKVETINNIPPASLRIPGWFKQAFLFFARDVLSKVNNKQYVLINVLEAPLLAFILATIVKFYEHYSTTTHSAYSFANNPNIPPYFFMSVIVALFMGLTVSAEEIVSDQKILKRESFLRLNRSSYLTAKIAFLFIVSAVQTLTFVLVGNAVLEIKNMMFVHWIILFSTSCFANVLGLNVSSTFDRAVTIYILIPILLIPQIILSGAVVKFDQLNPLIGSREGVPFIGNIMASRWAVEAAMVAQFRCNDFEKLFYPTDKKIVNAYYKKEYYIPQLEAALGSINRAMPIEAPNVHKEIKDNFTLLRNEISRELDLVKTIHFPYVNNLYPKNYDHDMSEKLKQFLDTLKQYYTDRHSNAIQVKDSLVQSLTKTSDKKEHFLNLKLNHQNYAVAMLVKNDNEPKQVVRVDNRLIQKTFPVYREASSNSWFSLKAPFYTAEKSFVQQKTDTLTFNIGMIWFMSLVMFITLYFNLFRKLLNGFSLFSSTDFKRM